MSKSNRFSIHRKSKRVMAGQWPIEPVGSREPNEPDAQLFVIVVG